MKADDAKRLKQLETENRRGLKQLLAEADHRLPRPVPDHEEAQLRAWLRQFATDRPRWGWRRAHTELRREGWRVNHKRVRRLWRDEGLQVPVQRRKPRLAGIGTHVGAMSPIAPDAIWAADFQFDRTIDGRQVKMCNIIDEFTREALAIHIDHHITADDVVAVLDRLALTRRPPAFVRFDNSPEFVAHAVADWARQVGTDTIFIDPGSPWQNAWIESLNGRLRNEHLNGWQFDSLLEAQGPHRGLAHRLQHPTAPLLTRQPHPDRRSTKPGPTGSATNRIPHSRRITHRGPLRGGPGCRGLALLWHAGCCVRRR